MATSSFQNVAQYHVQHGSAGVKQSTYSHRTMNQTYHKYNQSVYQCSRRTCAMYRQVVAQCQQSQETNQPSDSTNIVLNECRASERNRQCDNIEIGNQQHQCSLDSINPLQSKAKRQFFGACMAMIMVTSSCAEATDVVKVGQCLLSSCQAQLLQCVGDATCLSDLVCLQQCSGKPDEAECQVRCGNYYEDRAIDVFNSCAVTDQKCVPQKVDDNAYPVPSPDVLVKQFDVSQFQGRWFITAGLNDLFDTFPCQEHFFVITDEGSLAARINWRIPKSNGDFFQRSVDQMFVQRQDMPYLLENHNNEYLHYEDDWYIVASEPEEYVFVYYRGNNDAWKGYGGAVVYTRARQLPEQYIPDLTKAAESVGLKWSDFTITDNTCGPKPKPALDEIKSKVENSAVKEGYQFEQLVENSLTSFGRGFTQFEQNVESTVEQEERNLLGALVGVDRAIESEIQREERAVMEIQKQLDKLEQQYRLQDVFSWLPFFKK